MTRSASQEAFTTLSMGLFVNNPLIDLRYLRNINENDVLSRYGSDLHAGLVTFSRLSEAEQGFLVLHLQR